MSANRNLDFVSGQAAAIVKAGGSTIQEECDEVFNTNGPMQVGSCVMTNAGRLNTNFLIHTVGPSLNQLTAKSNY